MSRRCFVRYHGLLAVEYNCKGKRVIVDPHKGVRGKFDCEVITHDCPFVKPLGIKECGLDELPVTHVPPFSLPEDGEVLVIYPVWPFSPPLVHILNSLENTQWRLVIALNTCKNYLCKGMKLFWSGVRRYRRERGRCKHTLEGQGVVWLEPCSFRV